MNSSTLTALEWLLSLPSYSITHEPGTVFVEVGDRHYGGADLHDALHAAYEDLYARAARKEMADSEREYLPDYGD